MKVISVHHRKIFFRVTTGTAKKLEVVLQELLDFFFISKNKIKSSDSCCHCARSQPIFDKVALDQDRKMKS